MATLTVQSTDEDGIASLTMNACAGGGDQFSNNGRTILVVTNDDASSKTVTIAGQATDVDVSGYGKMDQANIAVAVAAGDNAVIGPFPSRGFNDSSGNVQITYSAVTSLTIGVVSVPD